MSLDARSCVAYNSIDTMEFYKELQWPIYSKVDWLASCKGDAQWDEHPVHVVCSMWRA